MLPTRGFADWPLVRGNAHATGVATSKLSSDLDLLWDYSVPASGFEATAVIADGMVYVGDMDGTFYALHLADGEPVWKRSFENSGFATAAAVVDGLIYVSDIDGVVRCLRAASGEDVWACETEAELYAAPNVHAGSVLLTTESGKLLAIEAQTGDQQWKFQIEAPLRCWPAVIEGRIFLAGCDERLHAVDFQTGKEVEGLDIDGPTGCTPGTFEKKMYFGTEAGTFYAIAAGPMEIVWEHHDPKRAQPIRVAAAVDSRAVIYGSQGKRVVALDPTTGKPLWEFPVRSRTESSPVIAGDLVFFATVRGRVVAVDIASGREQWQYEAGGNFQASPAVVDGKLVLGNMDGTLYCFGNRKKEPADHADKRG